MTPSSAIKNAITVLTVKGTNFRVGATVLVDVNGDGKPDIVILSYAQNSVSVLHGRGDGTFLGAQNFAVGAGPYTGVLADFNGDGRLDYAVANHTSNNVSVLLNTSM